MKRFIYTLSLIFIYLIISAKSCNQQEENLAQREQKSIQSTQDSIISIISTDDLSQVNLNAFEESAKIKFLDFIDYLGIIDSVSAPAFKELTKKQILNGFISPDCIFQFPAANQQGQPQVTLYNLLRSAKENRKKIIRNIPDSIRIIEPFHKLNPVTFFGKLGFSNHPATGFIKGKNLTMTMEIWLVKKEKIFDADTIRAWSVLLGNYRQY
jgi:hypothetical protein